MQDATISVVHSTINGDVYTDRLPARAASRESQTSSWRLWKGRGEADTHQENQNFDAQNKTIDFAKNVCHFYCEVLSSRRPSQRVFRLRLEVSTVVGLQISAQRNPL